MPSMGWQDVVTVESPILASKIWKMGIASGRRWGYEEFGRLIAARFTNRRNYEYDAE